VSNQLSSDFIARWIRTKRWRLKVWRFNVKRRLRELTTKQPKQKKCLADSSR
jgi:hypothetical protein